MIFPTLIVAIYIAWRNRHIMAELTHNVAITLWIMANSMWMISEFYAIDEKVRPYCIIPFSLGIVILLYYYLIYSPLNRKKELAASAATAATALKAMEVEEVS